MSYSSDFKNYTIVINLFKTFNCRSVTCTNRPDVPKISLNSTVF